MATLTLKKIKVIGSKHLGSVNAIRARQRELNKKQLTLVSFVQSKGAK